MSEPPRDCTETDFMHLDNLENLNGRRGKKTAAVWCVPALRVPMVHSKYTTFLLEKQKINAAQGRHSAAALGRAARRAAALLSVCSDV